MDRALRHHRLERTNDMNLKNFTAIIVTALGLIAFQQGSATEQLLQLPIQLGHAGVNQVVRDLQRHYGVDAATGLSALTNAGQPITLEDGTVITRALTGTRTHAPDWDEVAFDLKAQPCVRIERALALTGARKVGESAGSDTVLASVAYQFRNNHIRMDIMTYAPNLGCVGTVWIYKVGAPKAP
ncbi:hypothetical protein [Lysobacter capsici]|uniref:hypothetical protein n=1 Tax=Lysobacter capsici TaxID=435897 RepID=UPI001C0026B1|nr:hypothetical protein [Lysobacter capsici]QWF15108.1 hypothetical protein KME82_15000 [Lysobacter capsici]